MSIKRFRVFTILATLLIVMSLILSGCTNKNEGSAIAKVNGKLISNTDFDRIYTMNKKAYEEQFGEDILSQDTGSGQTFEEAIKETILENLITEEIVLQAAEKNKIVVTDEEVSAEVESYKKLLGGEEGFNDFLSANNMDKEYFRDSLKKEMIITGYRESIITELSFTDEEMKRFYDENINDYTQLRASHILVETEEEANEILTELEAGKSFGELAARSIEPEAAEREGDLGYFGKGKMLVEFEEAAFALDVGEISEPVRTIHGYHIIKVTDRIPAEFDKVKEKVKIDMEDERYEQRKRELREEAKVEKLIGNEE